MASSDALKSFADLPPSVDSQSIKPFTIAIPDEPLERLQTLLSICPSPAPTYETIAFPDTHVLGLSHAWFTSAVSEWRDNFSWREHEAQINDFPQYTTSVTDPDLPTHTTSNKTFSIHFAALFSHNPNAIPILLLHGWPGSFLEFLPMLSLLRDKYTPENLPYHLIVPSLPGYTFSSPPPLDVDYDITACARLFNLFMTRTLGFARYIVQAGDVGSKIARALGSAYEDSCVAVHLNFCYIPATMLADLLPEALFNTRPSSLSPEEDIALHRHLEFTRTGSAYALLQATKPSTLTLALSSSPLALLPWIAEKFLCWSDPAISRTPEFTTEILVSVTLYWLTGCIGTTLWPYRHLFTPAPLYHPLTGLKVDAGTKWEGGFANHAAEEWRLRRFGYSLFPWELAPVPRGFVERTGKKTSKSEKGNGEVEKTGLVWHRDHFKQGGGHFAALERPAVLLADLEDFVAQVWEA